MVNGRRIETVKKVDLLLSAMRNFVWQAREEGGMADCQLTEPAEIAKPAETDKTTDTTKSDGPVESNGANETTRTSETADAAKSDGSAGPSKPDDFGKSGKPGEVNAITESDDPGRDAIMSFLRMQSTFANKCGEYGYFVFDGFTDAEYPIHSIHVALASDGYPILERTLAQSENQLARLKADDPHLIDIYPSTKGFAPGLDSFDDCAYIRFTV